MAVMKRHGLIERGPLSEASAPEEPRFAALLECIPDPALVVTEGGEVVAWNSSASRISDPLFAGAGSSLGGESAHAQLRRLLEAVFSPERSLQVVPGELVIGDGTYAANASRVAREDGVREAVIVLRDINRLRKIGRGAEVISRVMAASFRYPLLEVLSSLRLASGVIEAPDPSRHHLRDALEGMDHLTEMIGDLEVLADLLCDAAVLKRQPQDLALVLADVLPRCGRLASSLGITLEHLPLAQGVVLLAAEPQALRRVTRTVVESALRRTRRGGRVTLRVESNDLYTRLKVLDDGPPLTSAAVSRIFEDFSAWTAVDDGANSPDMGLIVARRLVQAHGGSLSMSSAPGKGNSLIASFPRIETTKASP
jgi:signal transduction histidine kinase